MKPGIDYIGVAVGAMIFNEKNELFITKRSQKATNERGCWEIPGGKVELGETLQQAIIREIKEEYGVDIILLEQFPAANHLIPKEKQHWVPTTFLAKIKSDQKPKILEPDKCDEIGWFSVNKLPKPLSIITEIDLKYYQEKLRSKKEKSPQVSLDILVIKENKLLLGLLTKKWQYEGQQVYGIPGRDIYFGEKISESVKRNIKEDLNGEIKSYKIISINENYALGGHVIGIGILAEIDGEIKNLHPEDWEKWEWFNLDKIPPNLFPSAKNAIESYLANKINVSE